MTIGGTSPGEALRAESDRFPPAAGPVPWTCDGHSVRGLAGETLAASLTAIGVRALCNGPNGSARGIFCGMGVCWDCAVTVDGVPGVRACLTPLREGMEVETRRPPAPRPPVPVAVEHIAPDVLVVGGGPAGLSAALAASRAGLDVVLVDERKSLGGQYFKPLAPSHRFAPGAADAQFGRGAALVEAVQAASVRCLSDTAVWGAWLPLELAAGTEGRSLRIRPKRLILATGAYERALPLPGSTLPGAMTSGAAQMLIRSNRVTPGMRVVVAGNGPLNLQVAAELLAGGAEVHVIEAASPLTAGRFAALAGMVAADPRLAAAGTALLARLRRRISFNSAVTAVLGSDAVEGVAIATLDAGGRPVPGSERRRTADAVCFSHGFWPSGELARALGCRHRLDSSGALRPVRDADGRSSIAEIYIAGDSAGLGGAQAAMEEGLLAGHAAARSLGAPTSAAASAEIAGARRRLARHRRFQHHLWSAFAAPAPVPDTTADDAVLCRCEGVTVGRVRAAVAAGAQAIGAIKRETRAGMGRCQGRYCGPLLRGLARQAPGAAAEFGLFAPRPPARPVPIGLIAADGE